MPDDAFAAGRTRSSSRSCAATRSTRPGTPGARGTTGRDSTSRASCPACRAEQGLRERPPERSTAHGLELGEVTQRWPVTSSAPAAIGGRHLEPGAERLETATGGRPAAGRQRPEASYPRVELVGTVAEPGLLEPPPARPFAPRPRRAPCPRRGKPTRRGAGCRPARTGPRGPARNTSAAKTSASAAGTSATTRSTAVALRSGKTTSPSEATVRCCSGPGTAQCTGRLKNSGSSGHQWRSPSRSAASLRLIQWPRPNGCAGSTSRANRAKHACGVGHG